MVFLLYFNYQLAHPTDNRFSSVSRPVMCLESKLVHSIPTGGRGVP